MNTATTTATTTTNTDTAGGDGDGGGSQSTTTLANNNNNNRNDRRQRRRPNRRPTNDNNNSDNNNGRQQQQSKDANSSNVNVNNNNNSNSIGPSSLSLLSSDGQQQIQQQQIQQQQIQQQHCLVCYGDLTYRGKLSCGHDHICGVCHLRLRFLHDDDRCPICKQPNDTVIVDRNDDENDNNDSNNNNDNSNNNNEDSPMNNKTYNDYPRWGDDIGPGFIYRDDVRMFFERTYFNQTVEPLFAYACYKCDFRVDDETKNASNNNNDNNNNKDNSSGSSGRRNPLRLLQDHLRTVHRLTQCTLCIDHKRDFISKLPRMSPHQLQTHLKKGDGPMSGFTGHPPCEFCRPKRFYDLQDLHQHLHQDHYKCDVCERKGLHNQWFKHYGSLEKHFDRAHFLCHDVQCLSARWVVFDNELDLRAHELSVHGGTSTGSTKINLEFQTRRRGYDGSGVDGRGGGSNNRQAPPDEADFNYDLDGQAFVPDALPTQGGNAATRGNNQNSSSNNNNNNSRNSGGASSTAALLSTFSGQPSDGQLHPLHVQRTEQMRAQAAVVRQQRALQSQVESFPTLQSTNASTTMTTPSSSSAPLVGWTTGTTLQRVNNRLGQTSTGEAFPALPSVPKKKSTNINIGMTGRQFGAMSMSGGTGIGGQQQHQPSWGGAVAAAAGVGVTGPGLGGGRSTTSPAATTSSMAVLTPLTSSTSAATTRSSNQQQQQLQQLSNLAADNFPALGPSTSRPTGLAGTGLKKASTRKNNSTVSASNNSNRTVRPQPPPSFSNVAEFPPMTNDSTSAVAGISKVKTAPLPPQQQQQLPSLDSVSDFPPPPSTTMATTGVSGMLPMDSLASATAAKATVEDMKASLGPTKFKQLKRLTKDFAEDQLSPEGYVDQSAALFDRGYADDDFWSFVPSLLESCPNVDASQRALRYITSLRRQEFSDGSRSMHATTRLAKSSGTTTPSPTPWIGNTPNSANVMRQMAPPPSATAASAAAGRSFTAATAAPAARPFTNQAAMPVSSSGRPNNTTVPAKKGTTTSNNAWASSGGNAATLVRVTAPPGSVRGAAAAQEGPQGGTATKFMAQEKKKQAQANNSNNNQSNGKKKREKDELRALAYGR